VVYVPALNPIFKTEPLSLAEVGICLGAAVVVAVAVEIEKAWRRNRACGLALSADDPA
jgi:Ca2+-transporting ATPase